MRYKFGSFNLMNMGETAITKRGFDTISKIIRKEHFDVVALQEILSEGKALDNLKSNYLPDFDMVWKEPGESSDSRKTKDKRGEGFAFLWNKKRLQLANSMTARGLREYQPRIIDEALRFDVSMFARMPLYARLIPVKGGFFEFRLLNVHLHFGDETKDEIAKRKEEYDFLIKRVYPSISMERRYGNNREAYTIVMGDYNLNLYKFRGEAEERINKNTYIDSTVQVGNQIITTVQDELTSLKKPPKENADDKAVRGYSQNYDHFSYDVCVFENEGIKAKPRRIDAVRKYYDDDFVEYRSKISDHVPISLELIMNEPDQLSGQLLMEGN